MLTLLQPLLDTLGGHAARPPVIAWLGDGGAHRTDTRLVPVRRPGGDRRARPAGVAAGAALADVLAVVPPGHRGGVVEVLG